MVLRFFIIFTLLLASCQHIDEPVANKKALWIEDAFQSIMNDALYPKIKAVSWWHENFDASYLRVDSSSESLDAYRNAVSDSKFISSAQFDNNKLIPTNNKIYHAAYPDFGGTEDLVTVAKINAFENLVEKPITWAYFSNNWYNQITFPTAAVNTIASTGKTPFIRIMPRTNFDEGGPDPNYTMENIINGNYDAALTQWAQDAAATNIPLLVEFGTEANGDWFPWNGQYNGGATTSNYGDPSLPDGPERFRDAYRHLITICNANGASNITWFFHVDAYDSPDASWNAFEYYYPGDAYIDWLGVSIYGAQTAGETEQSFSDALSDCYPRLVALADKPIAILEFAVTEY